MTKSLLIGSFAWRAKGRVSFACHANGVESLYRDSLFISSVPGRQAATRCSLMRGPTTCRHGIPCARHEHQPDCDVPASALDPRCRLYLYCKHLNDVPMLQLSHSLVAKHKRLSSSSSFGPTRLRLRLWTG